MVRKTSVLMTEEPRSEVRTNEALTTEDSKNEEPTTVLKNAVHCC
jgi:hypothetical protein